MIIELVFSNLKAFGHSGIESSVAEEVDFVVTPFLSFSQIMSTMMSFFLLFLLESEVPARLVQRYVFLLVLSAQFGSSSKID
jgi:hypothetical protein